jgi:hypothetical protein
MFFFILHIGTQTKLTFQNGIVRKQYLYCSYYICEDVLYSKINIFRYLSMKF